MKPIVVDSGPLIAMFDADDKYHTASVNFIKKNTRPLVTTIANITEAVYVLSFSSEAQAALLKWIATSTIIVEPIEAEDINDICSLFIKYNDVPMDFADACVVHVCEKNGTNEVATIDSDFEIYRLKGKKPFKNALMNK